MSFPNDTQETPVNQTESQENGAEQPAPDTDTKPQKRSRFARLFGRERDDDTVAAETNQPSQDAAAEIDFAPSSDDVAPEHTEADVAIAADRTTTVVEGLTPTRTGLLAKIGNVFKGSFDLDDELFDDLEDLLIGSDVGIEASLKLVERLRDRVENEKIQNQPGVLAGLQVEIANMLKPAHLPWVTEQRPYVLLMVGVNGVGKTTTTAKIANYFQRQGKSVMLAAADTFRAAAVEQLQQWGERLDIPVITQGHGADAAAVAHDALTSAMARNIDILIIDTAGRLHTQTDLMEQLQKVNRVLKKIDPSTPHEVMQVLDAGTGQNALTQLQHFQSAVGVSSLCLTKLDGSAKGGVALALTEKYQLPIRFIGVGEQFADLKPFHASEFAAALIPSAAEIAST
ncbi:MAG: signal recognition particle-docking protein FtsY [Pseudomonadota bacterium]